MLPGPSNIQNSNGDTQRFPSTTKEWEFEGRRKRRRKYLRVRAVAWEVAAKQDNGVPVIEELQVEEQAQGRVVLGDQHKVPCLVPHEIEERHALQVSQ